MPNIPHGETAKNRMHTIAYPTHRGRQHDLGLHGPRGPKAPVPEFPYTNEVPKENVYVTRYEINCNWLQARGRLRPRARRCSCTRRSATTVTWHGEVFGGHRSSRTSPFRTDVAVEDTPIGVMYAGATTWTTARLVVNASIT
jgi:hypothetical protein